MKFINTKQREKIHFELFQEKYGPFQSYKHIDSPDFLVSLNGEIIGIEFTEIYKEGKINGKILREDEAIKGGIVEWARKKAIEDNMPPLHVAIIYSGSIDKKQETPVKESLFQIVKNNCPKTGESITFDFEDNIPDIFWSIIISNFKGAKSHIWHYTEASFVETNFSKQLQLIIDSKAEKISKYLMKCNKCWLVIVALGYNGSSFFEFSEEMENCDYKSPFEKVFFIKAFSKDFKELKLN
ncbi:MAG: hypothetical protein ABSE89_06885 [Sedimentisphaerales bacterium]